MFSYDHTKWIWRIQWSENILLWIYITSSITSVPSRTCIWADSLHCLWQSQHFLVPFWRNEIKNKNTFLVSECLLLYFHILSVNTFYMVIADNFWEWHTIVAVTIEHLLQCIWLTCLFTHEKSVGEWRRSHTITKNDSHFWNMPSGRWNRFARKAWLLKRCVQGGYGS